MTAEGSHVQIKGIRDGLLVTFGDAPWDILISNLIAQIDERPTFFQSARVALDVGNNVLQVAHLVSLRDILSERGITLWAVLSNSPKTELTAQNLGLATRISKPKPTGIREAVDAIPDEKALWIKHTLRSGTRISYPGHVVVLGDVNPGAEIVAGGSVLVWGRLRGLVHAGSEGDVNAIVGAIEFSPTQLRIASEIAMSAKKADKGKLQVAKLNNGDIITEPWKPG
jgi:septum site-determining protein MinC